jgi:hypothetical protein
VASANYSHVWCASGKDYPCNLTGNQGPDPNGPGIWVEITSELGTTYVPPEQIFTYEDWQAELAAATQKTPPTPATISPLPLPAFQAPGFVPEELRKRRQWIGWQARWDPVRNKYDKLPICIPSGRGDGFLKPENHVGYEEAVEGVKRLGLTGLGFVMTPGCGLIGGDLDNCRDPSNGHLQVWAREILDWKETYFEVSPSGKGVRFWAKGDLKHVVKHDPAGVELYASGRFLTFTAQKIAGAPNEIGDAPRTLTALINRVRTMKAAAGLPEASEASQPEEGSAEAFKRWTYAQTPLGRINQAAMERLAEWVPTLFPSAEPYQDGFRVKSEDLGRPLEEDISFVSSGIKDFGEHDMGDVRAGKRTPIDIVILWHPLIDGDLHNPETIREAAEWLADELEIPFDLIPGAAAGLETTTDSPSPAPVDPDADAWAQFYAALERLRVASPRPAFVTGGAFADPDDGATIPDLDYDGPVAIRPGITDRLTRGLVSMISAAANVGKSTYLSLEALAIALENGAAFGQPNIDWCGNVMLVSNEESCGAILARIRGQRRISEVENERLKHELSIWPTDKIRLRLGRLEQNVVVPTRDGISFINALATRAEKGRSVAFLGLDTLVSLFEGIEENSAVQMDKAIGLLVMIADAGFMAIDVMHHTGKSGATETTTSYRGSSAIFAAVAEMSTFIPLPQEEVERLKLSPTQAKRMLRMMGQRQRDGVIPGVWHFEREVTSLTAQDPRDPERLAIRTVATLKAIPTPQPRVSELDEAHQTLWRIQETGRQIRRGSSRGMKHDDWASVILQDELGWQAKRAERAVAELIRNGRVEVRNVSDPKGHIIVFLDMREPEGSEDNPF